MGVLPGAEPFAADGGDVGVVLSHGFTGTPQSMRPWAEALAAAGHSVRLPRLPGHGTRWQDLNDTRWPDWYGEVERAFDDLRGRCRVVFAMGLSMGGTLVLRLAEQRPAEVAGLVLVNPSLGTERWDVRHVLPLSHRLVGSLKGIASDIRKPGVTELAYDRTPLRAMHSLSQLWPLVVADLPRLTAPVLLYRSRVDHVVEPLSGRLLRAGAHSTDVTEVILEDSYHVATLDNDAPTIFAGSVDWVRAHSTAPAAG
ncbi:MAG: putative esterase/lipase [uncultured Corynebacteriales bacterium]|uniref:Putative esterase/lipase n=1 Tax=uncultured Mycobacteriales bacterium TaxID=581187 RepID=A0A6J4IIN8_9ACTN|nr:MAG: putative esterase/lipase [uncultured Corynebacteriales bacterium]